MNILFYSMKKFEEPFLKKADTGHMELSFVNNLLNMETSGMAAGYKAISIFAGDDASAPVLKKLAGQGVKYITTRAAGYDNIDLAAAEKYGLRVANVPEYSPYAIAEFAVTMLLALNRKIIIAHRQVQQQNFTVDNLMGMDLHQKTVGVIGTGKIGSIFATIMHGFGCRVLAYDIAPEQKLVSGYGVEYTTLEDLARQSDIISIHTPLNEHTKYLVDAKLIKRMKPGVIIINTARGGVVKIEDVTRSLQEKHIGAYGMDVYEKERGLFFYDWSKKEINDPTLKSLMSMEQVLITPHQAFATREALENIAATTFYNLECWAENKKSQHEITTLTRGKVMYA